MALPLDSPYDPSIPDLESETLTLDTIILDAMDSWGLSHHVAMPCRVSSTTDGKNQQVTLQPLFQARYKISEDPVTLPVIANVPVVMPMGSNYSIKLPVAVGDTGLAIFSDRSLDRWLTSGGTTPVDPKDTRQHDFSDPVFLPGLVPFGKQLTDNTTDMVLTSGSSQVRLRQDGKLKITQTTAGSPELIDLLDQITGQLAALAGQITALATTLAASGAVLIVVGAPTLAAIPPITTVGTQAGVIQSTVQQLKLQLDQFKAT